MTVLQNYHRNIRENVWDKQIQTGFFDTCTLFVFNYSG